MSGPADINHPSGVPQVPVNDTPTATLELDIEVLEAVAKSLGISMAATLKKTNTSKGHVRASAAREYRLLSDADVEVRNAIDTLLG